MRWFMLIVISLPLAFAGCVEFDQQQARLALEDLKTARAAATQASAQLPEDSAAKATLLGALGAQFGPWGAVAGIAVGAVWGIIERRRRAAQVEIGKQLVQSVEAALPEKTPELKAKLAGVQDVKTKAFVDAVKGR